jgi:hypothetical protein
MMILLVMAKPRVEETMNDNLITGGLGALLCLFGFSLYYGGIRMIGIFLGGSVGLLIGTVISYIGQFEERLVTIAVVAGVALIGAGLGWRFLKTLQRVVIILIGAGAGFLASELILPTEGIWGESWVPFASIVAGAVIFSLLFRYIIILVTAAIGSYLIYQASDLVWVMVFAFAIGVMVQIGAFHGLKLDKKVRVEQ